MANSPTKEPRRELDRSLLERGRLALATLQYEEQAARYRAAHATLLEAISEAEQGNDSRLRQWLDQRIASTSIPTSSPRGSSRVDPSKLDLQELVNNLMASTPIESGPIESRYLEVPTGCPSTECLRLDGPTYNAVETSNSTGHPFGEVVAPGPYPWRTSTTSSPWVAMELAANQRLLYWSAPAAERKHDPNPNNLADADAEAGIDTKIDAETDSKSSGEPANLVQSALTVPDHSKSIHSLLAAQPKTDSQKKRRRIASPDIWISILVHAFLLAVFSFWVIAIARPDALLSITASSIETDEVQLETAMESPTSFDAIESTSIPTPEWIPPSELLQNPQVASPLENLAIGPPPMPAQTTASSTFGQSQSAMAAGTKLFEGAEFFGSKAVGNTFVYVVDSSPSMRRDGAFEAAKEQIVRSLGSMKPKQRYHISFFGGELESMTFRGQAAETFPIPANSENLSKTMEWIGRIKIQKDGRPPIDALQSAIAMQPDGIFLLFDGDTKVDDWTAKVREINRSKDFLSDGGPKVPIHVIHFFRDEFEKSMRTLATENNGTYRFIPRPQKSPFQKPTP